MSAAQAADIVVVIHCSEDGDKTIHRMTKRIFLSRLKDEYWGPDPKFLERGHLLPAAPRADLPETSDLGSFVGLVIIDGDITVPKPVQVITEYEL